MTKNEKEMFSDFEITENTTYGISSGSANENKINITKLCICYEQCRFHNKIIQSHYYDFKLKENIVYNNGLKIL